MSDTPIENRIINTINTTYVKDNTVLINPKIQELLFDFGTIPQINVNMIYNSSFQFFNNLIADFNKSLSNMQDTILSIPVKEVNVDNIKQKINTLQSADNREVFDKIMEYVFNDEGGYVNHPKDPGGATNMGITQSTYNQYCKLNKLQTKNVKNLTKDEAKQVYKQLFWEKSGAKEIAESGDVKLAYVVFDTAIHSGVAKAKSLLSKSKGDADKMLDNRLAELKSSKNWSTFGKGWTNRIAKVETRLDDLAESKEFLA